MGLILEVCQKVTYVYLFSDFVVPSSKIHVLTIKTILANKELINEGLILFSADIESFFDKEDVLDVVNSLKELKINDKAIRMWYKLNENTKIEVKTAVGITDEANIGACVA